MDLKDQKFGIEIELTGISRRRAAEVAAAHFGTSSYYVGTYYDTYAAKDRQQREWKFMSDASIKAQRKEGKTRFDASPEYRTEMVSPICRYEDIVTVQELIRKLREAGAFANKSCGIHVHIDASPFDARTLRNITNIMAAKEDLIYKALQVSVARQHRWCQPVEQRIPERHGGVPAVQRHGPCREDQGVYPALSGDRGAGAEPELRQPKEDCDRE